MKRRDSISAAEYQARAARQMGSEELRADTEQMAEAQGYIVRHARDSRGQNLEGLPDTLFIHPGRRRCFWVEFKRHNEDLSPVQAAIIAALRECGQEVYVWRPLDWLEGRIEQILS